MTQEILGFIFHYNHLSIWQHKLSINHIILFQSVELFFIPNANGTMHHW
uniref:Uncharacterized protein n=1 Tax=Arundo donax TaxID=35708 RepID=A0A0A9GZD1_ARUDO